MTRRFLLLLSRAVPASALRLAAEDGEFLLAETGEFLQIG